MNQVGPMSSNVAQQQMPGQMPTNPQQQVNDRFTYQNNSPDLMNVTDNKIQL